MIASVAMKMIAREDAGLVRTLIVRHAEIGAKPLEQTCGGHLSHDEAAATVRMLDRRDIAHEAVCVIGRDRIVWLAARLAEAEAWIAAVRAGCVDNGVDLVDKAVDGSGAESGPWVVNREAHCLAEELRRERERGAKLARATRALAMGFTHERVGEVVDALKGYSGAPT